jgi:hypothetical protein
MIIWIDIEFKSLSIFNTFSNFTKNQNLPMVNKELVIKDFTETMKKHYGDRLVTCHCECNEAIC